MESKCFFQSIPIAIEIRLASLTFSCKTGGFIYVAKSCLMGEYPHFFLGTILRAVTILSFHDAESVVPFRA